MPIEALEGAKYRATGIALLSAAQLRSIDAYRNVLASKREVIIEMHCCDGSPGWNSTAPWLLPAGSNGGIAGHVLLIVGYDDTTRMFRVKNSWGASWGDRGYAWLSYDFVTSGAVYQAGYVTGAVSPSGNFDTWNNHQLWLDRWNVDFDGWKGLLDIYNLPDPQPSAPGGKPNYRIGTFFQGDGRILRVNGVMTGNRLDFWSDWNNLNAAADQLKGTKFTTYLFSWDHRSMAGSFREVVGPAFAIEARKTAQPVTGVAQPGGLSLQSYLGTWDFNHDKWRGRLKVTGVNPSTRRLTARYVDSGGAAWPVQATVDPDIRLFAMTIGFATPQRFNWYLNGNELGVMGGTTVCIGMAFGFMGTRKP